MSFSEVGLPVAFVMIDGAGNIMTYSAAANNHFRLPAKDIYALIDEESHGKFNQHAFRHQGSRKVELNMVTKSSPFAAFDVYISWESPDRGNIVLLPKDGETAILEEKLAALQGRLATTNFELLEKKDELDEKIKRLRELSGPFIALTADVALIPLFGDLSGATIQAITTRVLDSSYAGGQSVYLFDFTAIGEIEESGVERMIKLFEMMNYMGDTRIMIAGAKPEHSRTMQALQMEWPCEFYPSMESAFSKLGLHGAGR